MKSKIFVCFIGIDGSGKSTLSQKISQRLSQEGIKIKNPWARYRPYLAKIMMTSGKKLFLDKNSNMHENYGSYLSDKRKVFKKMSSLSKIYFYTIKIEYFFEILFKIIIPFKFGTSIIADRYVHDTVINDLCIDINLPVSKLNQLLEKFWILFPKPDITFLIKVPEEIAFKRKKSDIPSIGFLRIRNEYYEQLEGNEKIITLDGTLPISELEKQVLQEIKRV